MKKLKEVKFLFLLLLASKCVNYFLYVLGTLMFEIQCPFLAIQHETEACSGIIIVQSECHEECE